jgi:hypothetical protein
MRETGLAKTVGEGIAMVRTGAVFDVIGAVLCVVGVAVMAKLVGLA